MCGLTAVAATAPTCNATEAFQIMLSRPRPSPTRVFVPDWLPECTFFGAFEREVRNAEEDFHRAGAGKHGLTLSGAIQPAVRGARPPPSRGCSGTHAVRREPHPPGTGDLVQPAALAYGGRR